MSPGTQCLTVAILVALGPTTALAQWEDGGPVAVGAAVDRYFAGEKSGGIMGQMRVQVVLATPGDVRFGPRFLGWLASNVNANMLWKMRAGQRFNWTPPEPAIRLRGRGPIDAVTDLSVEKVFNPKGRVRPSFFLEVRNLFNTQKDTGSGTNYMRWGLQMAAPNDADYLTYGDMGDRGYRRAPRETNMGFRVVF